MATDTELRQAAIAAVKERNEKGKDFKVASIYRGFCDGVLVVVEFQDEEEYDEDNSVHIKDGTATVFTDIDELASFVNLHRTPKTLYTVMTDVLTFSGVAGLIAILLTITICAMSFFHPETKVPEPMWQALTVILGFYFGSKVVGAKQSA